MGKEERRPRIARKHYSSVYTITMPGQRSLYNTSIQNKTINVPVCISIHHSNVYCIKQTRIKLSKCTGFPHIRGVNLSIRFVSRYMGTIRYKKRCMLIKNDSVRFNSMQFNNWKHCVVRKQWTSFSKIFLSVFLNIFFLPTLKDQPKKKCVLKPPKCS